MLLILSILLLVSLGDRGIGSSAGEWCDLPAKAGVPGCRLKPALLRGWEHGRREPMGAAETLPQVAQRHPEVLAEVAQP